MLPHALLWSIAALFAGAAFVPAWAGDLEEAGYVPARALVLTGERDLDEISGLAVSRRVADRYWVHNDWPRPAALVALDGKGRRHGELRIEGVRATDWEDIASYSLDGKPWLLVGDIGDNAGVRKDYELIAIVEPELPDSGIPVVVKPAWRLRFRYPDAPHDGEALAVDVGARKILLLTKRTALPKLYSLPLGPGDGNVQVARHLGDVATIPRPTAAERKALLPATRLSGWPTGMDIDPAASRAIVLTYRDVWIFARRGSEDWATTFARVPERLRLPPLAQAEAIGFDASANAIMVSGERLPAPWIRYERRLPPNR